MPEEADQIPRFHGWQVLLWPTFAERYEELRTEARRLKASLPPEQFVKHPTVKLVAAISRLVTDTIPRDPNAADYRLRGPLAAFRRAKGHGLPPRYRLFWVFSSEHKIIIFLYLNAEGVLRREGDKRDVYAVFERLVCRGEISPDFAVAYEQFQTATHDPLDGSRAPLTDPGRETG